MEYITKISDCDNYLINYLPLTDIINLLIINTSLKKLVSETKIYAEYLQLKKIDKNKILDYCYEKGLINILKNYYWNGKNIIIPDGIDYASENGHIAVLEWFKSSGLEFRYSNYAISWASEKGNIVVLDWFKESGFEFKHSQNAIDLASLHGHISVLEWFKKSGLEFKYSDSAIDFASKNGHIAVLDWFTESGLEFK